MIVFDLAGELALLSGQLQHPSGDRAQREQAAAQLRVVSAAAGRVAGETLQAAVHASAAAARSAAGSGVVINRSRSWQSPARLGVDCSFACGDQVPAAPGDRPLPAASPAAPARARCGRHGLRRARQSCHRNGARAATDPTSSTRSSRPLRKRVRPAPKRACPLHREGTPTWRVPLDEPQSVCVAVAVCGDVRLEHDRAADDVAQPPFGNVA